MTLMLLFGAAAVALAAVGIYGVIVYATSQRRGEVATRLALGATSGNVFWLVLKQGQWLTMIGAAIGLLVGTSPGASWPAGCTRSARPIPPSWEAPRRWSSP